MNYKAIIYNIFNMMIKCPNCKRNMGKAYTHDDGPWHRVEKACYDCTTIIWVIFNGDSLHESIYITDAMKVVINHIDNKTSFYKRETTYLSVSKEYGCIEWIIIQEINETIELDYYNLHDMKLKMETMVTFS